MRKTSQRRLLVTFSTLLVLAAFATVARANHRWGLYHWARTANPFTLKLGDNVSSAWDAYLSVASTDWTASSVLDTTIVAGGTSGRRCRATNGRVEVCDASYGNNGWLGVASIWVNGDHITQGTVKLNDSYFGSSSSYNTPAWRSLVTCQEIGHTFGLDHQDTTFGNPNLGTCMDYTSNPSGPPSNEHPNQHDYDELAIIYSHLDSTTTVGQTPPPSAMNDIDLEGPGQWGRVVGESNSGRTQVYELDFGGGHKILTHVIWVEGRERGKEK